MDAQAEKIYVAIGNDLRDGFKTLEWTLGKWNSRPISIVILHVTYNISADFVYTPCKFHTFISAFFAFEMWVFLSFMYLFQSGSSLQVL